MSASIIDALPYYDKQADDPGRKAAAQALIDAELKSIPQLANDDPRLPPNVEVFPKSSALSELLDGYPGAPIRGIDPSKYNPPAVGPDADIEELKEAEKRGRIGEGHMAIRNENASILSSYGPNAWLVRNYQLNAELKELQETLSGLKEKVTDVNRSRRVFQEETGAHLSRLETRWQDLVGSTVQLEMACGALEGEVKGLRRKETELREQVDKLEEASA
ncbi:Pre-mRNA-splicing factor SPF27 [Papiliotrema laurentii]|uniref:Pre-mRNA-splicing factor SPF27 n=1 Tax=Papiliotrema laurentii TaxID=5418 RepID=A0AAD9CUW6_PAPLA|nr:Pre-mRNA-splicing factor SPF27 [Papiliotrema laurentii]